MMQLSVLIGVHFTIENAETMNFQTDSRIFITTGGPNAPYCVDAGGGAK